jgi:quinolinate synthase
VLCVPDEYLAKWVQTQTSKKIIAWKGHCEVHERFTGDQIRDYRKQFGANLVVIAHPECPPDVIEASDFTGSTARMADYVGSTAKGKGPGQPAARVLMVTECSMSDNLAAQFPQVEFVRPCNLCPHMKKITLANICEALETLSPAVEVAPEIQVRAKRAVDRMLELSR